MSQQGDDPSLVRLADLLVEKLLAHPRMEQTIREVVLRTLVAQDVVRRSCAARGFLSASFSRGVNVWLDAKGALRIEGDLGHDLNAALMGCHDDVVTHLRREREVIEELEKRREADEARQKQADEALYEEWRRCGGLDVPGANGTQARKT